MRGAGAAGARWYSRRAMRPERDPQRDLPRPVPDAEAEREVDFGRAWRQVVRRWWLVLAAVVLGMLLGYLLSRGSGEVYQARATIYLGQPLSRVGSPVQSLATNPATVSQIVHSDSVVAEVAEEVGVPPRRLERGISTKAVGASTRPGAANPLVEIGVRGPWRGETAQAANLLSDIVVRRISGYVDVKIDTFEEQLASQNRELASVERRLEELQDTIRSGDGVSSVERLQLLSLVGFAEQRRGQLLVERTETRQLLSLAENVERSDVVTPAGENGVRVPARSPRSSLLVGGLIGLIGGIALALLWEPLLRRRPRPA